MLFKHRRGISCLPSHHFPVQVDKTEVLNALRIRFGHRLFAEGDFDEAMAYFGMCSNASPLVLLNLFPSLAPPTLLEPLQNTISGALLLLLSPNIPLVSVSGRRIERVNLLNPAHKLSCLAFAALGPTELALCRLCLLNLVV